MPIITRSKNRLAIMGLACTYLTSSIAISADTQAERLTPILTQLLFDSDDSVPVISPGTFLELDGLIVIDMESTNAVAGWQRKSGDGAIGDYLEWEGQNSLNQPGNGLISVKVAIANPGIYRFIWRNSIREGTSTTDSNDSWLRVLADNFYGYRNSDNSTVCPVEQLSGNRCIGRAPEGSSADGWFKIYRSGGPVLDWLWSSFTSDSDAHLIFAEFDRVGEYTLQISARSKNHAIDRLVLFRATNASSNVSESFATSASRPESETAP